MVEKMERPKLPSPVKVASGQGQIIINVSGKIKQTSINPNVKIERID